MKRICFMILVITVLTSCKSKLTAVQVEERTTKLEQLATQLESQGFEITMDAAYPLSTASLNNVANDLLLQAGNSASRINLTDRNDFIKRKGDQVSADLSYFGERQITAGYAADAGIEFKDKTNNYEQFIDEKKGNIIIQFTARDENNETYPVRITVLPSMFTDISITSSHRTNIRYTGKLQLLESSDEL